MSTDDRLNDLGYDLTRVPSPAALYRPVIVANGIAYVSGALPFDADNLKYKGKVGRDMMLEDAQAAAKLAAANVLRILRVELGSLENVVRIIKLQVYVNSADGFWNQHLVANGASELMLEVFGKGGEHARAAVGVAELPLGAAVEVDCICQVRA